jgi:hypothetical protein
VCERVRERDEKEIERESERERETERNEWCGRSMPVDRRED